MGSFSYDIFYSVSVGSIIAILMKKLRNSINESSTTGSFCKKSSFSMPGVVFSSILYFDCYRISKYSIGVISLYFFNLALFSPTFFLNLRSSSKSSSFALKARRMSGNISKDEWVLGRFASFTSCPLAFL